MTERDSNQKMIGRYALYAPIASGGMATVHFGRLHAAGGFSRTVAIKRLHSQYASQPEFVDRFLDEARIAARIRHPNVIPTLDVVSRGGEVFLVMEYAHGESLSKLIGRARELGQPVPLRIASAIMTSVLHGLHDAHEARSETGQPLRIVHRDVSPQNVVVGSDGVTRILDFGIAKAVDRAQTTRDGAIRGKVAYMAPEQLLDAGVDRLTDIYAAAVVFWELLTGERIFGDAELVAIASRIMNGEPSPPPSTRRAEIPADLDALIMKGLSHDVADRPQSALAMATEIERIVEPASASRVAEWVQSLAADALKKRARIVAEIESGIVAAEDFGEGGQESEVMLLSDGAIIDSFTAPSIPVVTALDGPPRSKRAPPPLPASRSSRTSRILGISLLFA
ncbi:MAG: serine/threonine-protein kinase, partial [Polyangiaceae bacterium]